MAAWQDGSWVGWQAGSWEGMGGTVQVEAPPPAQAGVSSARRRRFAIRRGAEVYTSENFADLDALFEDLKPKPQPKKQRKKEVVAKLGDVDLKPFEDQVLEALAQEKSQKMAEEKQDEDDFKEFLEFIDTL